MNEILKKIFAHQEKLIGKKWAESRKNAYEEVKKMKQRQNKLSFEQAKNEAMLQAEKIRNERKIRNEQKNEKP